MTKKQTFEANFKGFEIPVELVKLFEFQSLPDHSESFSECFYLGQDYTDKVTLKTCSEDDKFLNAFIEFAIADGSGSTYAFWIPNNNKNLSEAPVVVFGSEGGAHIIAKDIREFLQVLAFDKEPDTGWEDVNYFKDYEDYEQSEFNEEYKEWLSSEFGIICEEDEIDEDGFSTCGVAERAFEALDGNFQEWLKPYNPNY